MEFQREFPPPEFKITVLIGPLPDTGLLVVGGCTLAGRDEADDCSKAVKAPVPVTNLRAPSRTTDS